MLVFLELRGQADGTTIFILRWQVLLVMIIRKLIALCRAHQLKLALYLVIALLFMVSTWN